MVVFGLEKYSFGLKCLIIVDIDYSVSGSWSDLPLK